MSSAPCQAFLRPLCVTQMCYTNMTRTCKKQFPFTALRHQQHAVSAVPQLGQQAVSHVFHKHFILYLLGFYVKMLNKLNV